MTTAVSLSQFARGLSTETAFDVLAVARRLKSQGKDVIELQIGDSPYPTTSSALAAGKAALDAGHTRYAPSMGLPEFRAALKEALESTPSLAVSHGVLDFTPADHWGYRPDTGVVMKVVNGEWSLEK